MTDNHTTLFCLIDGEATFKAFSIKAPPSGTVDDLKGLIKAKKTPRELDPTDDIADVFTEPPLKKTIHILVQPRSKTLFTY
ncbi:hypothetical protein DFQ27_001184 [Actinomortierella ambigua]|uniref:Crinkler effector protein N-terminal domain-containing protein n=1 Tax=Actinomortierella ambigua TaxID=1343610 RepID=A0A9P6QAV9_9FUNG|nr:hypothetical protein DFQ27_001184 [Actinomortierella ambigua]